MRPRNAVRTIESGTIRLDFDRLRCIMRARAGRVSDSVTVPCGGGVSSPRDGVAEPAGVPVGVVA